MIFFSILVGWYQISFVSLFLDQSDVDSTSNSRTRVTWPLLEADDVISYPFFNSVKFFCFINWDQLQIVSWDLEGSPLFDAKINHTPLFFHKSEGHKIFEKIFKLESKTVSVFFQKRRHYMLNQLKFLIEIQLS